MANAPVMTVKPMAKPSAGLTRETIRQFQLVRWHCLLFQQGIGATIRRSHWVTRGKPPMKHLHSALLAMTFVLGLSHTAAAQTEDLTDREREVLELVMHGFGNKVIAERLGVTVAAVKWHLQHIYEKLHVHSRTEAALKFKQGQASGN